MSLEVTKLLNDKGISFITKGNDAVVICLNPDHQDSSPSMRIDRDSGQYHCLACGFGGHNIFEYFNEYFNPVIREARALKKRIADISLDQTGIILPEGVEYFLDNFRDIPPKIYKKFSAFQHPNYEDRLCFPIFDAGGKLTNIVARNMHSAVPPKYKVYPEGRTVPIYPTIRGDYVILVEGIFDLLNLDKNNISNVSCIFGTQSLSHKNIVDKFMPMILSGVRDVFLLLDNDKAGNDAANYLKKVIENKTKLRTHIINDRLPYGKDPGSLDSVECKYLTEEIQKLLY